MSIKKSLLTWATKLRLTVLGAKYLTVSFSNCILFSIVSLGSRPYRQFINICGISNLILERFSKCGVGNSMCSRKKKF